MGEQHHAEVRRVFEVVLAAPAREREAVLARECAGDAALLQEVRALLEAADADSLLSVPTGELGERTPVGPGWTDDALGAAGQEAPGQRIGRYTLVELLGEGGFGSVWLAEQHEPVKRQVAIKVIKMGMDTRQVIARFEAERQALAVMDHPSIARVFDAGATDQGRPFFVMELVRGVPIVEYCDRERLGTRARLDLFAQVCHAIQHAHQKGIIHRDIKPSNVLVATHDGHAAPKVIDFGIAKATNAELAGRTAFTEHRHVVGTPAYMSPEQALLTGQDIDTRSDVYSLGVLLYELLTGTTPFPTEDLLSKGLAEMMRIIREVEPHKPSTRLSSLGQASTRTAEQRDTDPKRLGLILRGDLDWIVMKCLEKDRQRRYETPSALAADIARHLAHEPVAAGPPGAGYRLRKFVRRHRGRVVAGGVVAAALVAGLAGTSTGLAWAIREKDRADALAASESEARRLAEGNERRALDEAERAERELARANEIKRLIADMLTGVSPEQAQGADTTLLKGILDDAAERLSGGEITDALIAAELHAIVGSVYSSLGLFAQAEEHLPVALETRERLLGGEHPDTLASMNNLANLYSEQGRHAEAEPLYLRPLETRRRVLGEQHPDTLASMSNLAILRYKQRRYAEAEPLLLRTLESRRRVLGAEHPDTLASMNNLASLYLQEGRYAEAEPLLLQASEAATRVHGEEHPVTRGYALNVAHLYRVQGRYADAESLYLQTLEFDRRVKGEEHPGTLMTMSSLADLYRAQGRYAEAEPLHLQTLEIQRRVLGEEHPDTLLGLSHLADLYRAEGRHAEAEPLYLQTLETQRRVLGEEHERTLASMSGLASLYLDRGRYADARRLLVQTLESRRRVQGEEHPDTLATMNDLARLYFNQRRYAEAEPLFQRALEGLCRMLGEEHRRTLVCMGNLANVYRAQDRDAEAESLYARALESMPRVLGEEHPETLGIMLNLADVYLAQSRYAEAEPLYLQTLESMRRVLGEEHRSTLGCASNLANLYLRQGRHAEAEPLFLRTLEIRRRVLGAAHPNTLGTTTNLGLCYNSLGRYQDAAALLEVSLPLKRRVLGMRHPWTSIATEGLATAYDQLGRRDEALPLWRELLERMTSIADAPDASAETLNKAAWVLLTHDNEALLDPDRARGFAERACMAAEASGDANLWQYLDTLALAQHRTGDTTAAIETQRRAIALMPTPDADPSMHERLAEYEAALADSERSDGGP